MSFKVPTPQQPLSCEDEGHFYKNGLTNGTTDNFPQSPDGGQFVDGIMCDAQFQDDEDYFNAMDGRLIAGDLLQPSLPPSSE